MLAITYPIWLQVFAFVVAPLVMLIAFVVVAIMTRKDWLPLFYTWEDWEK